jgi:hypothetical protein
MPEVVMAKIIQEEMTIRFSRIVKDSSKERKVISDEDRQLLNDAIEQLYGEDETKVVEVQDNSPTTGKEENNG